METLFRYYGRYQNVRGSMGRLPGWAKAMLFLAAIPGIVLILLSVLVFIVSVFALLLLTLPLYRVLVGVSGRREPELPPQHLYEVRSGAGRKHVDVTIVE